jgi:hypothetical protein
MELRLVLYILLANAIISLAYSIIIFNKGEKTKGFLMLLFTLLCPVIALAFLLISWLSRKFVYSKKIDMDYLSFSTDKRQVLDSPDFEKEINVVSIEEALIISGTQDKRRVILDVLKEDSNRSITMLANALEDEDSETSHYAASMLADVKSDFKVTVQQMNERLQQFPNDEEIILLILNYINGFIEKKILDEIEEVTYIEQYEQLMNHLYEINKDAITGILYRQAIAHLLFAKRSNEAVIWAERSLDQYPKDLDVYKGNLKLYYEIGNRDMFFRVLSQMKESSMDYDSQSIDLMKFYSKESI